MASAQAAQTETPSPQSTSPTANSDADASAAALPQFGAESDGPPVDDVQQAIDALANGEFDEGASGTEQEASPKAEKAPEPEAKAPSESDGPKESPSQSKPKASAWAALHRKEVEFQKERAAFAQEREEVAKFKRVLENAKEDRIAALEAMGYTDVKQFIEDIAQDGGRISPERKRIMDLERKIQEREAEEKRIASEKEQQQLSAETQRKIDAIHEQVVNKINADYPDSIVAVEGASHAVMQELDRLAGERGVMPDLTEAIENVQRQHESSLRRVFANPRVRAIAQELLASPERAVPAASKKAHLQSIGSNVTTHTSAPEKDPFDMRSDGDRELDEMVAWLRKQK